VVGSCERYNEILDFIKDEIYLDLLSNSKFLTKVSATRN
jgi:hypothetical protein